jgi:hypothetical protein
MAPVVVVVEAAADSLACDCLYTWGWMG